jgi:hypothetical protein
MQAACGLRRTPTIELAGDRAVPAPALSFVWVVSRRVVMPAAQWLVLGRRWGPSGFGLARRQELTDG